MIGAALRGVDVVMIASNVNISTQRLISRPEIKTWEDLRGKRVGVTAFGSNTHSVLPMVLKRWSMKPEDLVILQVGPSLTMVISLEKGFIDAAVLTSPADFMAEEKGNRVLADLADMKVYSLQSTLSSTREYLRGHEDQATRFVKGYAEGIAFIKKIRIRVWPFYGKNSEWIPAKRRTWARPMLFTPQNISTGCLMFPFRESKRCWSF